MEDDNDLIVCRCEEVTTGEILAAIRDGARSVNAVKKEARAGMGFCQGKTCGHLVRRILAQETGLNIGDVPPGTYRPPVRTLKGPTLLSRGIHEEDDS